MAHPRHKLALDTLAGVRSEMARLYRLTINDRIKSAESARLVYILREVRACIEAIPPTPVSNEPGVVNIVEVPAATYIRTINEIASAEAQLVIDHIPAPPPPEPIEQPPAVEILPPEQPEPELIEEDDDGGVFVIRSARLNARRHKPR